jgi:hypothetical protein
MGYSCTSWTTLLIVLAISGLATGAGAQTICGHEIPWTLDAALHCDQVIIDQLAKDGLFECKIIVDKEIVHVWVHHREACDQYGWIK